MSSRDRPARWPCRTAEAIALETTDLSRHRPRDFLELLAHDAALAARIIGFLCRRLRWMSERMEEATLLPLDARLARRRGYAVRGLRRRNPGDTARTRRLRWRGARKASIASFRIGSIRHHRSWASRVHVKVAPRLAALARPHGFEAAEGIHPHEESRARCDRIRGRRRPGHRPCPTRCTETTRFDPPLRILRCTDGLTLEAERAATLRPVDRDGDGQLEGAEIGGSAVLVTLPTRSKTRRGGFQILTPPTRLPPCAARSTPSM